MALRTGDAPVFPDFREHALTCCGTSRVTGFGMNPVQPPRPARAVNQLLPVRKAVAHDSEFAIRFDALAAAGGRGWLPSLRKAGRLPWLRTVPDPQGGKPVEVPAGDAELASASHWLRVAGTAMFPALNADPVLPADAELLSAYRRLAALVATENKATTTPNHISGTAGCCTRRLTAVGRPAGW
jgi:hypothetical protein